MAPLRPLRYSNDCPELPASAPVNHPHLIDVTNWDETKIDMRSLRFCDGFFTLMYKWKPCAVDLFLNWNSPVSLVFTRKPKETSDWARDLVVIKKGNRAEVGFLPKLAPKFNPQVTYTIEASGEWTPVDSIEDDFAHGFSADGVGGPRDAHLKGAKFAAAILTGKMWDGEWGTMAMRNGLGHLLLS